MSRSSRPDAVLWTLLLASLLAVASSGGAAERVRDPAVAGRFYPREAKELRANVDEYLAQGAAKGATEGRPIALIAPHAGYPYSGRCAGRAYAAVKGRTYQRVVVLAVNHRGRAFRGASILDVDAYKTPLGTIPLDRRACDLLLKHRLFDTHASAHRREHSLEVQLPFLQRAIGSFRLVPIIVGYLKESDYVPLAAAIRQVVDDQTLVVASTDFTHYGRKFRFAPFREKVRENIEKLDKGAVDFILKLDGKGFRTYCRRTGATICGRYPVGVLVHMLPAEADGKLVEYYCSGDVDRDYSHSVSYASIVFTAPGRWRQAPRVPPKPEAKKTEPGEISEAGQRRLLELARKTLTSVASARGVPEFKEDGSELQGKQGVFVTLNKYGRLRGCIGNFKPTTPLYQTVVRQTHLSALRDRRFKPVLPEEVEDIEIDISVLSHSKPIKDPLDWEFGKHGITVRRGIRQATYLPQVAEHFADKEAMLSACCRKAGLPPDSWRQEGTTVEIYRAEVFGEAEFEEPSAAIIAAGRPFGPSGTRAKGLDRDSAAVVIGISEYAFLGKIRVCRSDAREVAELLKTTRGIAPERIALMTDDAESIGLRPTKEIVLERIRMCASEARPDGLAFVYFSGHTGRKGDELLLVPADCRWERGIPLAEILAILQKSKAGEKVLVIDGAHANASQKGSGLKPTLVPATDDVAVFLSCGEGELSQTDKTGKGSIYTRAFLGAFRELAAEGKGVTAKALQRRITTLVRRTRTDRTEAQTPALRLARGSNPVLARPRK